MIRVGTICTVGDGSVELHACVWIVFLVPFLLRATLCALAPPVVGNCVEDEALDVPSGAGV
jgi:hypothetical protein